MNHGGDINKIYKMVDDAEKTGCECVKFQCYFREDMMINDESDFSDFIWNIIEKCEISMDKHILIKKYIESKNMIYLCTPFSSKAAEFLYSIGVNAFKIGSGECNNYPLVKYISNFKKPIILSTGMNNLKSIEKSVNILESNNISYALLSCTSLYPTPYEKMRLGCIEELRKFFPNAVIGLSDHSKNNYISFAAIALGASIIEKHFISNEDWESPDKEVSISPSQLEDLIKGTAAIYQSLGGKKNILDEEKEIMKFATSYIVSIKDIKKGETFSKKNIWVKRSIEVGLKADMFKFIIGEKASKDISKNKLIKKQDIKNKNSDVL